VLDLDLARTQAVGMSAGPEPAAADAVGAPDVRRLVATKLPDARGREMARLVAAALAVVVALGAGVQVRQEHLGEDLDDERFQGRDRGAHDADVDFDAGPDCDVDALDYYRQPRLVNRPV